MVTGLNLGPPVTTWVPQLGGNGVRLIRLCWYLHYGTLPCCSRRQMIAKSSVSVTHSQLHRAPFPFHKFKGVIMFNSKRKQDTKQRDELIGKTPGSGVSARNKSRCKEKATSE